MRKILKNLFYQKYLIFILFILSFNSINSAQVYDISEEIKGNSDYKKVSFESGETTLNHYFKHSVSTIPQSRIGPFRIDFDSFNELTKESKVYCTFVDESTSDDSLISQLNLLDQETSSCVGAFNDRGFYDGIIEYHQSKKKLGIFLYSNCLMSYTGTVYVRINENILSVKEQLATIEETYSLVPFTIVISDFRESASKILFYSYTRELQMYYVEQDAPYPEKLFSGNIMSVYTNPNMVRQKYHNANYMVLLTRNFTQEDKVSELFKFQVKLFPSNYLLDYYMSDNPEGRSKNSPLSINMTECDNPYYVILNYNRPEKKISLYIDQIYGKIKSLSVAPTFTNIRWDDMIVEDMQYIDINSKKFELPEFSETHMDVYKVECQIPLLLNFYYVDESASIPELNYGQVAITTLKSLQTASFPFAEGVMAPGLTIEVFNPIKLPTVYVNDGQNEQLITRNTLIKSMPFTTSKPLVIKERGGDSNTRVIIKVGYNSESWGDIDDNIKYNENLNMFVFSFPSDTKKLNYTFASLTAIGTKEGDNIKYCYGTNIGSAILPSNENCYRVSLDNSYTLKFLNPLVMHKDYVFNDNLNYYVSIRPVSLSDKMELKSVLTSYDTNERNLEGIGNTITIGSLGEQSSILTAPANKDSQIFVQVAQCEKVDIEMEVVNAYEPTQQIIAKTKISSSNKNFYKAFNNILLESEIKLSGTSGTNVYVRHAGIRTGYNPGVKESASIEFNSDLNQLIVENPLNIYEGMRYTVFVDKSLSDKGITLCSFTEAKQIAAYNKTVESYNTKTPITINFNKVGLKAGDTFEAIVYIEQLLNSKMVFLSEVFTGKVGEIKTDSIVEISSVYSEDNDYVYAYETAKADDLTYYFSYLPTKILDVPFGAFSIEVDSASMNDFSSVDCAFVESSEDAMSMIEAVETVIEKSNSYCYGARSTVNTKRYNYIFRYEYTKDKQPKKLVIKISNGLFAEGGFNVYIRKGENTNLENTNFEEEREYGKQEEFKKSVMPYIVDLSKIRGDSETDYASKVLIYSQYLEMEMYYLDPTETTNFPLKLFSGNIMLVYTKLTLAEQKYHTTQLILLSERLSGQEHSSLGNKYRFHTKMYKSDAQIEYFVSNNPSGRTLNNPISLEMNICSSTNNKYYYILNYNKAEDTRILYLDLLFGSMKKARIAKAVNAEKWSELIQSNMEDLNDYTINLDTQEQHIDIIEIQCNTPLLANVYYNYENQIFSGLNLGDIAIQYLGPSKSTTISLDTSIEGEFYYSVAAFNPKERPDIIFKFGNSKVHEVHENSVQSSFLYNVANSIDVINNGNSATRFILKIGYGVESKWIDEKENIEGTLYSKDNKFVYKFPCENNKRNFTNVTINVKPMKIESGEEAANIKFCYSTSVGMPIDASLENCFRTGKNIPYSLTFVNPLITPKNYRDYSGYYYVTLSPYYVSEYISLEIVENKYDILERNMEGVGNIVTLIEGTEKSTILTIPDSLDSPNILVQLQICRLSATNQVDYTNLNAYTKEELSNGTLRFSQRFFTYWLQNNLMETQIQFTGLNNDQVFVKHVGIKDYHTFIQEYTVDFDPTSNVASIVKPIFDEGFRFTVLVGRPYTLMYYTLCTFAEKRESEYKDLADYVYTFTSTTSNVVTHYIDFRSFGYKEGDEFDLLVYAVQNDFEKLEFIYSVKSGVVGKIQGIVEILGSIPGRSDYVTQSFEQNTTNNYVFYNFQTVPEGDVAMLNIKPMIEGTGMTINKVGCAFVTKKATDEDMVSAVNNAVKKGTSVCIGETQKDDNGFDALINAKDVANGYPKLIIQIIYGLGEEEQKIKDKKNINEVVSLNITLRIKGFTVDKENYGYNENEALTMVPYVFDLDKIRGDDTKPDYNSKVLIYSNTREMQMFYLDNGAPVPLFSGNIMLVYTNKDMIKEKYFGASTMILLTDALDSKSKIPMGENFRFKINFFRSSDTIQYYVSANPSGRLLNNPTSIEMLSCDQPYYYILNYNYVEPERILHIDNIFGEVETIKIGTALNQDNWYDFINNMKSFIGAEYIISEKKYHIDVLEVTCTTPLLLNVYYTDAAAPKKTNLDQGDISIISIPAGRSDSLSFKMGLTGEFIYSFTVLRENDLKPKILISFNEDEELKITTNGITIKPSNENYPLINIYNKILSGSDDTKIIFKFGYNIEKTFTKIENDIWNLQTSDRPANLFAYLFKNGDDRLNYTKVNFTVYTKEENVKFCYSSNLGAFIDPSLQNCFRVGKSNSYTISVLNPYIMYKSYYTSEEYMKYYVSFRTENKDQNITIVPLVVEYPTKIRNMEGYPNTVNVSDTGSTILTIPANNTIYIFVQMNICTPNKSLSFEFKNAFYNTFLGAKGEIQANTKNFFRTIQNTNLDTELVFNITKADKADIFVKHIGTNSQYTPIIKDIIINYNFDNQILYFNQPIEGEEFIYTIYLDKSNYLKEQSYTLCSFIKMSKLAHYTKSIRTSEANINFKLDFEQEELKGYEAFDLLILAEQVNKGRLMILSDVFQTFTQEDESGSNAAFVIVVIVLSIVLIAGGIFVYYYLKKYKSRPMENKIIAKPTNLDDIARANQGEKMLDSMANSQASENQA